MKRAESIKHNRKKYSKNCSEFLSQPFDFARKNITIKPRGEMKNSKADVDKHFQDAHGDQSKTEERKITENLHKYKEQFVEFNDSPPS